MASEEVMTQERTSAGPYRSNPAANALAPFAQTAIVPAGGAYDFVPRSLDEAMKLAEMLAGSTMVPKDFVGKPGNCFIAMQWGAEVGFKPLQAIQNIAVINGRPGLFGDAGKALLLSKGYRLDIDDTAVVKTNGVAKCVITAPNGVVTERTFSLDDAKQANLLGKDGPWKLYPYRQMSWRAFWFCARDAAADVLKGMAGVEELRDMTPEKEVVGDTPAEVTRAETPKPQSKSDQIAAGLKKVTAEEVYAAFDNATTKEMIVAAVALATKAALKAEEQVEANNKFHAAKKRVNPDAVPTVQDVQHGLRVAKNVDELDVAASLIDSLTCDADMKEALRNDYKTLRNDLTKE